MGSQRAKDSSWYIRFLILSFSSSRYRAFIGILFSALVFTIYRSITRESNTNNPVIEIKADLERDTIIFVSALRNTESSVLLLTENLENYAKYLAKKDNFNFVLIIYHEGSSDDTADLLAKALKRLKVFDYKIVLPEGIEHHNEGRNWYTEVRWPKLIDGRNCDYKNKNCRLGQIRERIRLFIKYNLQEKFYIKNVIVVDGDIPLLPHPEALLENIRKMNNPDNQERIDGIFANGIDLTTSSMDNGKLYNDYYDTFATILTPEAAMQVSNTLHDERSKENNERRAVDERGVITLNFEAVYMLQNNQAMVPVLSAFGGMGIYNGESYLGDCSYSEVVDESHFQFAKYDQASKTDHVYGWPCEHVVFHLCSRGNYFIATNLVLIRQVDIKNMPDTILIESKKQS